MTKQKILLTALGLFLLLLIGGWIFVVSNIATPTPTDLQNSIIQPSLPLDQEIEIPQKEISASDILMESVGILQLAVPHFIDQAALQALTTKINTNERNNITLEITQATSLDEYKKILQHRSAEFDLILIPSLWETSFGDSLSFPFQENISALFQGNIGEYIQAGTMKFIPFGLDPILTISARQIEYQTSLSWIDIEKYLLVSSSDGRVDLGFGISDIDSSLLTKKEHPIPGYLQMFEYIIASSIAGSSHDFLFQLTSTPLRDIRSFLTEVVTSGSTVCKKNATLCLFNENLLEIGFSSLSEYLFYNSNETTSSQYLAPLPTQGGIHGQLRSFASPGGNTNKEVVLGRIQGYLEHASTSNIALWNSTLPVFNSTLDQYLLEKRYTQIKKEIQNNKLHILRGELDNISTWYKETALLEVLNGEYNAKIFIEEATK